MIATSRSRAALLLIAVLVTGLVVGWLVGSRNDRRHRHDNRESNCTVKQRRVCFWSDILVLTPEQQDSLAPVYDRAEATLDSIQRSIRPAIDSVYNSIKPLVVSERAEVREQVRQRLTVPQREKYDSIVNAWDHRRSDDSDSEPQRGKGKGDGNDG